MQGKVVAQMTNGIDRSATVIVFVTTRYCLKVSGKGDAGDDDNCKREFEYACLRKGVAKMITVVMEPCCRDTKSGRAASASTSAAACTRTCPTTRGKRCPADRGDHPDPGRRPNPPA